VLVLAAIAAGSTAAAGGVTLIPGLPDWVAPSVALVGLVATAVAGVFTQGQVTPTSEVGARKLPSEPGEPDVYVAGEAHPVRTGKVVDVTAVGAADWVKAPPPE
jgi:hypothetical protein